MAYIRAERLEWCLDGFLASCTLLKDNLERNPSAIAIPLVVNAAFASELALKRLIERQTGTPVRGHELRRLWEQIDNGFKAQVIPPVCNSILIPTTQFDEFLDKFDYIC